MKGFKLKYIDTGNMFNTMNTGTMCLSNISDKDLDKIIKMRKSNGEVVDLNDFKLTGAEKRILFDDHRMAAGEYFGFDGKKIFMADQKNKNGSFFELTRDYVEANPNGWSDIDQDFLITTKDVPGVVACHPVADCPVVMMSDDKLGITAVAHCSGEMIDKMLPEMVADCLLSNYNSKVENIRTFVGACAGNNWDYDSWPAWAQEKKFWEQAIVEENGIFKIDLRKALAIQFKEMGIKDENVSFDMANTLDDDFHYSNARRNVNPDKLGRHLEGAFYIEEGKGSKR